jgi:hypothetical protein
MPRTGENPLVRQASPSFPATAQLQNVTKQPSDPELGSAGPGPEGHRYAGGQPTAVTL